MANFHINQPTGPNQSISSIDSLVHNWSKKAQIVARDMVHKYGMPREATPSMLIWYRNGQWKYTIVHRTGAQHNFPAEHIDLLEQAVDYWVPVNKVDDVIAFDGSIKVDRTKGEMSVCCDNEANNYLALNLAHDIILGKKDRKDARQKYAKVILGLRHNWQDPYAEKLHFEMPEDTETRTADPDTSVVSKDFMKKIRKTFGF